MVIVNSSPFFTDANQEGVPYFSLDTYWYSTTEIDSNNQYANVRFAEKQGTLTILRTILKISTALISIVISPL